MASEFDQLVAQFERFEAQLHRVDEQFANLGEMRQQLAEMEAVATSADRSVTVVAGPSGSIKDIRLTDEAWRGGPNALAAELMSTLHKAVAEAARRQAGIVEGALGDDMHLSDQVLETQAELFGMSKEDLKAAVAGEVPPPAPEDFSDENVLRAETREQRPPSAAPQPQQDGYLNLFDDEEGGR